LKTSVKPSAWALMGFVLALTPLLPAAQAAAGNGETATEEKRAYPVVAVRPIARSIQPVVYGYGTVASDPQGRRSITAATMVEIEQVLVAPGQAVRRGQPLFRVAAEPAAYLAYQQAVSARRVAKSELERLKKLLDDRLATVGQVETAEKAVEDAEAAVAGARRQLAAAPSEAVDSPIDGVVSDVTVAVGDRPAPGTSIATIVPSGISRVIVGIEPSARMNVRVGDRATVTAVQQPGSVRPARVAVVGAALDKETRLVPVTLLLEPPGSGDLIGGLSVEAQIATRAQAAFVVPRSALVKDDDDTVVFEVVEGKAHRVPVALVREEGARVAVTGALSKERAVVTVGAYELEDGAQVVEQKP